MSEVLAGQREHEGCAKGAPFTAAYCGTLRIRSCINKEYPQSPTTISIAISSCLHNFTVLPTSPSHPLPLFSPFLLDALNSRVSTLRAPPLLETMRLPIAFAIPQFHRANRAHILPPYPHLRHSALAKTVRSRILLHFYKAA